jgi:site-specific recombinase XerD
MLDELQRRNYSSHTVRSYMHAVEEFARYFRRSPDQLGPDHIREYQVHLFRDCKLSPRTIEGQTAALRFLFVKTLGRGYLPDQIPFPKCHKRLPTVLSQEEVARLIDSAGSLMHRAMIMTLYATGGVVKFDWYVERLSDFLFLPCFVSSAHSFSMSANMLKA